MAHIERRRIRQPDGPGRVRGVTRYRVRYRDESGRQHCETKMRLVDAERRKAEIEVALAGGTWCDPRRGEMRLNEWAELWLPTRHDLRATTSARLRPPCRSRFYRASATRRFGRSPTAEFDSGSPTCWPAASPPRQPGKLCSRFASVWMPRSPTIVCSSTPPLQCVLDSAVVAVLHCCTDLRSVGPGRRSVACATVPRRLAATAAG
jgi:hypothetical protein